MSNATQRNFAAMVGERNRRQARINEGEDPIGLAQAAYLGPGWDAFFGSLHDQGEAANAAGMDYRVNLSGLGRSEDDPVGGGLTPFDRDSLKQQAMNMSGDAAVQQARAEQFGQQTTLDQQARGRLADQYRLYDQQTEAAQMAPPLEPTDIATNVSGSKVTMRPAGTPEEQMLARLSPKARAKAVQDIAVAKAKQTTAEAALEKAKAASTSGTDDVKLAVQGMKDGTLPPQLPGRASKEYVALLGEAKRQGYDLATAATDWSAAQKHFATLNGAQQTRIQQATDTAYHSLDVIDNLAEQWEAARVVKDGKFIPLNKAELAAAKSGVYGKTAQSIATQLEGQITDVTSELGNVYMGGNSPTDHALKLAGKNLSADWSKDVLKDMTALARKNLQIRRNSIANIGATGASAVNPYAPRAGAPTGASEAVEEWVRDASGKLVKKGKS